jgi:hypothetical protein
MRDQLARFGMAGTAAEVTALFSLIGPLSAVRNAFLGRGLGGVSLDMFLTRASLLFQTFTVVQVV